jgi:hypothetical protein
MALERLPADLPVPVDDGAASHLVGTVLHPNGERTTDGGEALLRGG